MLSERLKSARCAKNISQETMALKLNVVRQTVSKWEKGLSVPDAHMIVKIAEILDLPVSELLRANTISGRNGDNMKYDVIIIGAGPGGIFAAYELMQLDASLKVAVFEAGNPLSKRHCPIDGEKIKSCINCKSCSIMSGFGGAGAFSDGKYNITNDFGGTLYEYIGKKQALDLMHYVDKINLRHGGEGTKLYSTAGSRFKTLCIQNDLHLLDASVRHLGTDINYVVLENI
ncbi:MAG: helix-turn-helix domain-containing protein, partial [Oscillospiraceae bacterium]|nr:helix-turn-helix domain-containing protein [Oscillospiraceae bacterium]